MTRVPTILNQFLKLLVLGNGGRRATIIRLLDAFDSSNVVNKYSNRCTIFSFRHLPIYRVVLGMLREPHILTNGNKVHVHT
jgi:hypothetical protein